MKWTETRSENMVAMWHGRGQVHDVELGLKRDGTITGLRVFTLADAGAYPAIGAFLPFFTQMMAQNVYVIPKVEFNWQAAITNTHAGRGVPRRGPARGDPHHGAHPRHRRRRARHRSGRDPAQELHPARGVPVHAGHRASARPTTPASTRRRSTPRSSRPATTTLRAEQAARRERGDRKMLGIGVASYLEISAPMAFTQEYGAVEIEDDGTVTARVGTSAHGQGHETAFSMIVSDALGVPMENVRVLHSDTDEVPRGGGTGGSRSLQIGGSALFKASEEVLAQAKQLAAHLLEASPDDIVLGDGGARSRRRAREQAVVGRARGRGQGSAAPAGRHGSSACSTSSTSRPTARRSRSARTSRWSRSTPRPVGSSSLRHIAVDDCGTIINPLLVAGQQHGGIAQGVAQALWEEVQYDDDGNPITANLMDYAMPSAAELPSYETYNTETPSPLNPLGAKGIGESATLGSTPAVHNAVIDAVSHLGVRHIDMPCTAERVWRAMQRHARRCARRSRRLRLTESQYATIVGNCYDGLPDEACGLLVGPLGGDGEPTGVVTEARPCRNADASAVHLHRRPARHARRDAARPRPAATRSSACGTPTPTPTPTRRPPTCARRSTPTGCT